MKFRKSQLIRAISRVNNTKESPSEFNKAMQMRAALRVVRARGINNSLRISFPFSALLSFPATLVSPAMYTSTRAAAAALHAVQQLPALISFRVRESFSAYLAERFYKPFASFVISTTSSLLLSLRAYTRWFIFSPRDVENTLASRVQRSRILIRRLFADLHR